MSDFLVRRDDLRVCQIADAPQPELGDGEVLLKIDRFGLTANNITYAVFGDAMHYWDFFPATQDGWGRVPTWGFADVVASRAPAVGEGIRVYGYLPPSSYLVVQPEGADSEGFVDGSAHRAPLPSAYHRYLFTEPDPFYTPETEALQMLLRPLFYTSFLIDDALDDEGHTAGGPILISSASSKTSLAAAFLLSQRPEVQTVGLTSEHNREFVEELDIYSGTVTYDEIASLAPQAAMFVDVAGDAEVRLAVHSHCGDALAASMVVGATHWETMTASAAGLPGPTPKFFFAPDRVTKRGADWGRAGLNERVAAAWRPFCAWAGTWLQTIEGQGFDAVRDAYLAVLDGQVEPARAHVLTV